MGDTPPGAIVWDSASTAPSELYLAADGTAVSRTTYRSLFSRIGTTHGVGDGSTTFNLPNIKGKVPVHHDAGQTEFDTVGETGGAKTHTLSTAEIPSHSHGGVPIFDGNQGGGGGASGGAGGSTNAAGGGGAHNNLQPYIVLKAWVKVL